MKTCSHKKGFTLVELIIVVSIIAVLASLAFMALSGETAQNGNIVLSSAASGLSKTVKIYKTGLVESQ